MTDKKDWIDETKGIFDLKDSWIARTIKEKESKQRIRNQKWKNIAELPGIMKGLGVIVLVVICIALFIAFKSVILGYGLVIVLLLGVGWLIYKQAISKKSIRRRLPRIALLFVTIFMLITVIPGIRLSITPLVNSDVGAGFGGLKINDVNAGEVFLDGDYSITRFADYSPVLGDQIISCSGLGLATDKSLELDIDSQTTGKCDILLSTISDSIPCDSQGTRTSTVEFIDYPIKYETIDGNETRVNLFLTYIKANYELVFHAYWSATIEGFLGIDVLDNSFQGEVFATSGIQQTYAKSHSGILVLDMWAYHYGYEGEDLDDYDYMTTAIVDAQITRIDKKITIANWNGNVKRTENLNYGGFGGGTYNVLNTLSELNRYATCKEALQGLDVLPNRDPGQFSYNDQWEEQVYVQIPYEILLGCSYEMNIMANAILADSFEYVQDFIIDFDITYAVLTGYSDLLIDYDPDPPPFNWSEFFEQIINFIRSFWSTGFTGDDIWGGKVVICAMIFLLVGGLFFSIGGSFKGLKDSSKGLIAGGGSGGTGGGRTIVNINMKEVKQTITDEGKKVVKKGKGLLKRLFGRK